jgi:tRNA dimethylallyltransferase
MPEAIDRVVVILGPTCVGKTQVSLELADILNGEIVSFDSRQIYRHMDIGTAKPTKEEQKRIPHHFVDRVSPDEKFTAADYAREARQVIRRILERKRQPVAVGGSGLYLRALTEGFFEGPRADERIRRKLMREAQEFGEPRLFGRLKTVDPEAAERIHPNDLVRIVRALEVHEITGKPISLLQRQGEYEPFPMRFVRIGLNIDRKELYQRIERRVEEMIAAGLVKEVEMLKERGFSPKLKSLKTVGYQELFAYLDGEVDLDTAVRNIKLNTRHYAKRQLTWFRQDKEVNWLDAKDGALLERIMEHLKGVHRNSETS